VPGEVGADETGGGEDFVRAGGEEGGYDFAGGRLDKWCGRRGEGREILMYSVILTSGAFPFLQY
jgi:hypothetical protein